VNPGVDFGALSLLAPLLAIALAIYTRQVYVALAGGIWAGWTIVAGGNPATGLVRSVDAIVRVLTDPGNARILLFTFAVGSLIALVEANGGVRGFVEWVERRRWVTTPRRAQLLAWLLGLVIFIESNITILVAGSVSRPLFDRFRVAREKLAYVVDSTSAPVCILIPFNAWGAYVLGILGGLGVGEAVPVLLASIPLNLYALAALISAGASSAFGIDWGPMARAQARTEAGKMHWDHAVALADPEEIAPPPAADIPTRPVNMIVPIAAMVATMPVAMYLTGSGDFMHGSGSVSVLWAVLIGIGAAWLLSAGQRLLSLEGLTRTSLHGAAGLTGMALVLLLALTLGDVTRQLGTGEYVAHLAGGRVPAPLLLPMLFVLSGGIAFATGSSWGTFAIMLPVAVPLAAGLGLPLSPFVAATLSGGIFGDHTSPISDTTIISSMASGTDHIEHVRTQLPYALASAAFALAGFSVIGAVIAASH